MSRGLLCSLCCLPNPFLQAVSGVVRSLHRQTTSDSRPVAHVHQEAQERHGACLTLINKVLGVNKGGEAPALDLTASWELHITKVPGTLKQTREKHEYRTLSVCQQSHRAGLLGSYCTYRLTGLVQGC